MLINVPIAALLLSGAGRTAMATTPKEGSRQASAQINFNSASAIAPVV
jgi:hypothetical protein